MSIPTRVTIHDVARESGVSVATVSKVINGRYGVSQATAARVQTVIDSLGYESSLVARSLRSLRTNVIGILVAEFEPFSTEILKGTSAAIAGTGFELLAYSGGGGSRPGWERRYLSRPVRDAHRRGDPGDAHRPGRPRRPSRSSRSTRTSAPRARRRSTPTT